MAHLAACSEDASIRSEIASACIKSILLLRNARSENSPARANRAPSCRPRCNNKSITAGPPWPCSSKTSSPVNEFGAGK